MKTLDTTLGTALPLLPGLEPAPKISVDDRAVEVRSQGLALAYEALAGERESALEAGTLGFMARILVQVTMPHSKPKEEIYRRENGNFCLTMFNDPRIGLPYGRYPRLIMAWVTTRALREKSRELELGQSLTGFMSELGIQPTGGNNGTIKTLRNQMRRLFTSTISVSYASRTEDLAGYEDAGFRVADSHRLWWKPKHPEQSTLWGSSVVLSEAFFKSVTTRPVPVDLRALKELRSPLALDLYVWLGWRLHNLNESGRAKAEIPWELLQHQFGAQYKHTRQFKAKALGALKQALRFYPDAAVLAEEGKLVLKPSPLMIPKKY